MTRRVAPIKGAPILSFLVAHLCSLLLTVLTARRRSAAKDLEILALRHQVAVLQRRQPTWF